jgi:hypothetical protein
MEARAVLMMKMRILMWDTVSFTLSLEAIMLGLLDVVVAETDLLEMWLRANRIAFMQCILFVRIFIFDVTVIFVEYAQQV